MNDRWILKHFIMAAVVSSYSKDNSVKCGAVIVRQDNSIASTGYNGFPRGVDDTIKERYERPIKYLFTEHAERNAIYNSHENLKDYSIFIYTHPQKLSVCSDCARAIIQSGISDVYLQSIDTEQRWEESCQVGIDMLKESYVNLLIKDIPDLSDIIKAINKKF